MNKSQLVDAVAADSGLSKADAGRAVESVHRHGHQDAEKRRRGEHHRLRQVLGRQTGGASGREPAHRRAREDQSLEGAEVHGGRDAQAGRQPEKIGERAVGRRGRARDEAMTLVSELELPGFDYTDPSLQGRALSRGHARVQRPGLARLRALRATIVLDREAGEWWLRTRDAIFPGMTIAEIFDVREGPLYEQMQAQHPARQRPRPHAPAQPREPGAERARGRALPAGDALEFLRGSCGRAHGGRGRGRASCGASSSRPSPSPTRRRRSRW